VTIELIRRPGQTATDLASLETLLSVRGIAVSTQPLYALAGLVPPDTMKGLDPAASLLVTAIQQQSRILIIGDYDADGATSVALMIEGLRLLGARHVEYLVPNRFEYGYGLSPELVDLALTQRPDLIITVDQGIVSFEGVAAAKAAGVRVIVTDHHLPGQGLPAADAIVNPNQNGCEFPSKALAGVGVAFYLLIKTRALLVAALPEGSDRINLAQLLDLVALGTVADLVPLDENNRRLVQSGIKRIRAGRARPGIQALIEISGLDHRVLTTTQLAFNVAPRLNAAGRLEDMSLGVACLLATPEAAQASAARLDELNRTRREIEQSMQAQAAELLLAVGRARIRHDLASVSLIRDGMRALLVFWPRAYAPNVPGRYSPLLRPQMGCLKDLAGRLRGCNCGIYWQRWMQPGRVCYKNLGGMRWRLVSPFAKKIFLSLQRYLTCTLKRTCQAAT